MRTLAIVPMKRFELAKQRLREGVDPQLRRALAAAMLADVLTVLTSCGELDATLVVTRDREVVELAEGIGADVTRDPHERGQSAATMIGIAKAVTEGYERVLLAPGDTPALSSTDLIELLAEDAGVAIVPDRHGTGTNALLLHPPDAIVPSFGPGSFARHRDAALAAGHGCAVAELPTLMLDIDTPEDLDVLRRELALDGARGPRTRALLLDG